MHSLYLDTANESKYEDPIYIQMSSKSVAKVKSKFLYFKCKWIALFFVQFVFFTRAHTTHNYGKN